MKVVIVTDAGEPQVNGVVMTLNSVAKELRALGHEVIMVTPAGFRTIPCPTYPEIRLSLFAGRRISRMLEAHLPCAVHIATEGPLGLAARRYCIRHDIAFSSAVHTRFPEYLRARFAVPAAWTWALLRRFHDRSQSVMVSTASLKRELEDKGFRNVVLWTRGVDTAMFRLRPEGPDPLSAPRPRFLYVGRVAVEKNIGAFLSLNLPGSKIVVGDGPMLESLRAAHPDCHFLGLRTGEEIARIYAASDVFVFPSRTDTFGLVLLEALASGLPIAAYRVPGPLDIVSDAPIGVLHDDLGLAARLALEVDRALCRANAEKWSWRECARQFMQNLHPPSSSISLQ